jgi:CRP-like cAMP-binding protein
MDHSVVALTDCTVTTAPHAKLRDVTSRYPHLGRLLWLSTLLDSAIHRQWIVGMVRLDARAQLCHLFCEAYLRLQVVGLAADCAYDLPLSERHLADVHAQSVDTIDRELRALREDGVVSKDGARVRIMSWEKLTELAEFDPTYLQLGAMPV